MGCESSVEEIFDGTLEQFGRAEALDPTLSVLPDGLEVRFVVGAVTRHLLHQHAGPSLAICGQEDSGWQLLGRGEIGFQGFSQRIAAQGHDSLVPHASLVGLDRHRHSALGADQLAKDRRPLAARRNSGERRLIEAGNGAKPKIMCALRNEQAYGAITLKLQG